MAQMVNLALMDGLTERATLVRPFKPEENEIEVILERNGIKFIYQLSEICCIMMEGQSDHVKSKQKRELLEEVETTTGERYHVYLVEPHDDQTGFYGYPADPESPFKFYFFPLLGIRKRRVDRFLGQILEEKGLVNHSVIEDVLEEQKKLRRRRVGEIIADHSNLPQETIEKTLNDTIKSGKASPRARVGDILIAAGLVTRDQVEKALASQEVGKKKRVGTLLIERGLVTEDQLLTALAAKFRMRFVDLELENPTHKVLAHLSYDVVSRMKVFPIEIHADRLVVATSQPTDPSIGDTLRFHTNRGIEMVVATSQQISEAIRKYYGKSEVEVEHIIGELTEDEVAIDEEVEDSKLDESDSQIINLVNKILIDAYKKGVSDIHFEPGLGRKPFRVRYRIDGICHVAHQVPSIYKHAILSRIKIISKLDIAERRKPQSGKILMRYENQRLEYRVETTPTVGDQEDAVLRILSVSKPLPLEKMGFSETNLKNFKDIISKPYGIVLCVGPTGSGKTTTLHSGLGYINTMERKIWTAEDPVEITQPGLRQVQVHPKIGLTFQEAFRSFLRSDPDVIMIGEMRDKETAKTAVEASLTGHLVFSTLHTNSAPETVVRLIEMGVDSFTFADALLGILAQRLARRFCQDCKEPYHPTEEEYEALVQAYDPEYFQKHGLPPYSKDLKLMRKVGCNKCGGIGYKGRIAVHELLVGTGDIKKGIKKSAVAEQLKTIAVNNGMTTLRMDGIRKIFLGVTDLEQVLRVCL